MKARALTAVMVCLVLSVVTGCAVAPTPAQAPPPPTPGLGRSTPPRTSEQASTRAFTDRILRASSTNGVITDARMRGTNELGVILGREVPLKKIKPLMVTLLKEMRKEFPDRDLTVRAYAPNGKLMATMAYDDSAPSDSNVTFDSKF